MRKLTALIISFVFLMTMAFSVPAMADETVAEATPIEIQATSDSGNYTPLSNGQSMTFKITLEESGSYSLVSRQITWVKGVQYKVYINEKPMGIVDAGNTLGSQETTNAELGTFDLCAGYNEIRLQIIGESGAWIYKLTLTRIGDATGKYISVHYQNRTNTLGAYAGRYGSSDTFASKGVGPYWKIANLAESGVYRVYLSGRSVESGTNVYMQHTTDNTQTWGTTVLSDIDLPANGEYNSHDTVCIGDLFLTKGYNMIDFLTTEATGSWTPCALHLEKVGIAETGRSSTWGGYNDVSGEGQPSITFSGLEPGTYDVIGSAASWSSNNTSTAGETITAHIFTAETVGNETSYPKQEFSFVEKGFTTWVHNIKFGEVTVSGDSKTIYFICRDGNSKDLRINNVNLVKKEPVTKIYLGEEVKASKECSTLTMGHATLGTNRKGKITVQTTLPNESQDAVMIAALYDNGKIVSAAPVTTKLGATLTGTLDASNVSNINTCYVKVFVWDSIDNLTPLAKVLAR